MALGKANGLERGMLSTLATGGHPDDLEEKEGVAFDVAKDLLDGRVLPTATYEKGVLLLGQDGMTELINLVGLYCLVSVNLNGFDATVPT